MQKSDIIGRESKREKLERRREIAIDSKREGMIVSTCQKSVM